VSSLEDKINEFAVEFDQKAYERHVQGEEKYGPGTWLKIDTLQHAMDEVLDLGNYAKFTYIKLRLLQEQLLEFQADSSIAQAKQGYDGPLSKLHTGGIPE
jgi:hypothetical protein